MNPSRAVLITGVSSVSGLSSGTGRATALRLHHAGWPVYATGRSLEGLKDLAEQGITTLQVDVTSEDDPYTVSNTFMLPIGQQNPRTVTFTASYDW